jgi:hypothetical protein
MEIKTLAELRKANDDNLMKAINSCLALQPGPHGMHEPDARHILESMVYLDELRGRRHDRQTSQMLKYTCLITAMTGIVTVATIVNLICLFR